MVAVYYGEVLEAMPPRRGASSSAWGLPTADPLCDHEECAVSTDHAIANQEALAEHAGTLESRRPLAVLAPSTVDVPHLVLLLSEERPGTLEEKWRAWQLDDGDVHLLMRHQAHGFTWAEIVPRPSATATRKGSAPSSSTRSPHGAACERTRRTAQAPSTRFCGR